MGDAEAYSDFYERSYSAIVGQVFVVTTDRGEAEEAVQEGVCAAVVAVVPVSRYENPEAWVRRVALNVAMKRWRRARRGDQLVQDAHADTGAGQRGGNDR